MREEGILIAGGWLGTGGERGDCARGVCGRFNFILSDGPDSTKKLFSFFLASARSVRDNATQLAAELGALMNAGWVFFFGFGVQEQE
jgi:hypothetical protein